MARVPFIVADERGRQRAIAVLGTLSLDKPWSVLIEPYKRSRTLNQNALYHKWVGIIADDTGNSHDAVHEALKQEFLPPRTVEMGGKVRQYRPSTTALTSDEMAAYMNHVYAWAGSELGIILPVPEDAGRAA